MARSKEKNPYDNINVTIDAFANSNAPNKGNHLSDIRATLENDNYPNSVPKHQSSKVDLNTADSR